MSVAEIAACERNVLMKPSVVIVGALPRASSLETRALASST
jgi:hypothetical protein